MRPLTSLQKTGFVVGFQTVIGSWFNAVHYLFRATDVLQSSYEKVSGAPKGRSRD